MRPEGVTVDGRQHFLELRTQPVENFPADAVMILPDRFAYVCHTVAECSQARPIGSGMMPRPGINIGHRSDIPPFLGANGRSPLPPTIVAHGCHRLGRMVRIRTACNE